MAFPYEYRAEVVGDAVAARRQPPVDPVTSARCARCSRYLLLQAATGSWRGAAVLLFAVPFAAVGACWPPS